jgi:hypothetical protein
MAARSPRARSAAHPRYLLVDLDNMAFDGSEHRRADGALLAARVRLLLQHAARAPAKTPVFFGNAYTARLFRPRLGGAPNPLAALLSQEAIVASPNLPDATDHALLSTAVALRAAHPACSISVASRDKTLARLAYMGLPGPRPRLLHLQAPGEPDFVAVPRRALRSEELRRLCESAALYTRRFPQRPLGPAVARVCGQ